MTYLLRVFALLLFPVMALAQNLGPEELVKKITSEVMEAIKTDKQLAAGDKQKALKLAEEKILPHVDFEEAGKRRRPSRRKSWCRSSAACWCAPTRTPSAPTKASR
jgi:ABC-type transporter MlaC component